LTASPALSVPPAALDRYESLRSQAIDGGTDRTGLAAVCYHGMLRGLEIVAAEPPAVVRQRTTACDTAIPCGDRAVVCQLANMILQLQPEPTHAW